jgi:hypothetical protein
MEIPLENIRQACSKASAGHIDLLDRHAAFVSKLLRKDWDWWTGNEGYEGTGKSNGSLWTALKVAPGLFDISEHVCYTPDDFLRLVEDTPRYGVFILDEAGEAVYNRNYNTELNKAIVMASQQMRDRNLYVEFNLPALELLDSALRRRFRTLVIYEAPKFERGRSMWHVPVLPRYGRKSDPYFDLSFVYYFRQLPTAKREEYTAIKTKMGRERLAGYREQVQHEQGKNVDVDPAKIVDRIRRLPEGERAELLGSRGAFSRDAIRFRYKLPESVARSVVAGLRISPETGG